MRLPRPHIPIEIRCLVAARQIGCSKPTAKNLGAVLREILLPILAHHWECKVADLRLDHEPALALRDKIYKNGRHVDYDPPAASADHLMYRTKQQHDIKTRIRGDGAQFSDLALIRREKRRASKLRKNPRAWRTVKTHWPKRKFESRKKS